MKQGQKTRKTIAREAARAAYQQLVLQNLRPLFSSQMALARGVSYVYRIDRHGKGSSLRIEHVLLEDPREIADALDIIENGDPNGDDEGHGFYYVTTKAPENRAIDSMLDRSIGKPAQPISGDPDNRTPIPIMHVSRNDGDTPRSKAS